MIVNSVNNLKILFCAGFVGFWSILKDGYWFGFTRFVTWSIRKSR